MKPSLSPMLGVAAILLAAASAQTPTDSAPARPANPPPVEALSFKVGTDYYPMLDRANPVATAENPDFPRVDTERMSARRGRRGDFGAAVDESRTRGKLRSHVRVISDAQWVRFTVKNAGAKAIKSIDWDFAFPRRENGKPVLRYDVSSKVEIKAGGKKTLKQPLPAGATRCQAVIVKAEAGRPEMVRTVEAVCGPGFLVPSQLDQETFSIKRIEYADGSVWQRQ